MKSSYLYYLLIFFLAFTGCKEDDEDTNQPSLSNENKILSFKIHDFDTSIEGLIDHDNKTITLNVPFNADVANLAPTVIPSEKATVSPESDAVVDFTEPVQYTVTAENGEKTVYTVMVSKQSGEISISYVDPFFTGTDTVSTLENEVELLSYHLIVGKNFSNFLDDNKVYLINESGESFPMTTVLADSQQIGFTIPEEIPLGGGYTIKLVIGEQEVTFPQAIEIVMPEPQVTGIDGTYFAPGAVLGITGEYLGNESSTVVVKFYDESKEKNDTIMGQVISSSLTSIKVKIPDNMPEGEYIVIVERDEYQAVGNDLIFITLESPIVISGVNKTTFKRGETIIFSGSNFLSEGKSAEILFYNSIDQIGEYRQGISNAEGTELSYVIPADFVPGTYIIQLTKDRQIFIDFEGEIVIEE